MQTNRSSQQANDFEMSSSNQQQFLQLEESAFISNGAQEFFVPVSEKTSLIGNSFNKSLICSQHKLPIEYIVLCTNYIYHYQNCCRRCLLTPKPISSSQQQCADYCKNCKFCNQIQSSAYPLPLNNFTMHFEIEELIADYVVSFKKLIIAFDKSLHLIKDVLLQINYNSLKRDCFLCLQKLYNNLKNLSIEHMTLMGVDVKQFSKDLATKSFENNFQRNAITFESIHRCMNFLLNEQKQWEDQERQIERFITNQFDGFQNIRKKNIIEDDCESNRYSLEDKEKVTVTPSAAGYHEIPHNQKDYSNQNLPFTSVTKRDEAAVSPVPAVSLSTSEIKTSPYTANQSFSSIHNTFSGFHGYYNGSRSRHFGLGGFGDENSSSSDNPTALPAKRTVKEVLSTQNSQDLQANKYINPLLFDYQFTDIFHISFFQFVNQNPINWNRKLHQQDEFTLKEANLIHNLHQQIKLLFLERFDRMKSSLIVQTKAYLEKIESVNKISISQNGNDTFNSVLLHERAKSKNTSGQVTIEGVKSSNNRISHSSIQRAVPILKGDSFLPIEQQLFADPISDLSCQNDGNSLVGNQQQFFLRKYDAPLEIPNNNSLDIDLRNQYFYDSSNSRFQPDFKDEVEIGVQQKQTCTSRKSDIDTINIYQTRDTTEQSDEAANQEESKFDYFAYNSPQSYFPSPHVGQIQVNQLQKEGDSNQFGLPLEQYKQMKECDKELNSQKIQNLANSLQFPEYKVQTGLSKEVDQKEEDSPQKLTSIIEQTNPAGLINNKITKTEEIIKSEDKNYSSSNQINYVQSPKSKSLPLDQSRKESEIHPSSSLDDHSLQTITENFSNTKEVTLIKDSSQNLNQLLPNSANEELQTPRTGLKQKDTFSLLDLSCKSCDDVELVQHGKIFKYGNVSYFDFNERYGIFYSMTDICSMYLFDFQSKKVEQQILIKEISQKEHNQIIIVKISKTEIAVWQEEKFYEIIIFNIYSRKFYKFRFASIDNFQIDESGQNEAEINLFSILPGVTIGIQLNNRLFKINYKTRKIIRIYYLQISKSQANLHFLQYMHPNTLALPFQESPIRNITNNITNNTTNSRNYNSEQIQIFINGEQQPASANNYHTFSSNYNNSYTTNIFNISNPISLENSQHVNQINTPFSQSQIQNTVVRSNAMESRDDIDWGFPNSIQSFESEIEQEDVVEQFEDFKVVVNKRSKLAQMEKCPHSNSVPSIDCAVCQRNLKRAQMPMYNLYMRSDTSIWQMNLHTGQMNEWQQNDNSQVVQQRFFPIDENKWFYYKDTVDEQWIIVYNNQVQQGEYLQLKMMEFERPVLNKYWPLLNQENQLVFFDYKAEQFHSRVFDPANLVQQYIQKQIEKNCPKDKDKIEEYDKIDNYAFVKTFGKYLVFILSEGDIYYIK